MNPATNTKERQLTHARLLEVLAYDPETGVFTWRVRRNQHAGPGTVAGRLHDGYVYITVDRKDLAAHRLAWFYMHKAWPNGMLDHKDTARNHNRIDNLREATNRMNTQNVRVARANSRSGLLGVSWNRGRWTSNIRSPDGRQINLGRFDDPQKAHEAYVTAKRELHAGNTL